MKIILSCIIFLYCEKSFANRIIAKIGNNTIITEKELNDNIKLEMLLNNVKKYDERLKQAYEYQVMTNLINGKMALIFVRENNIPLGIDSVKGDIYEEFARFYNAPKIINNIKSSGISKETLRSKLTLQEALITLIRMNNVNKEISQEYINFYLKNLNLAKNPQNEDKARQFLSMQNSMDSLNKTIAKLKTRYYIEIIEKK